MIAETMARINLPGFALAVVKDGEVVYAKGFGVTSLDGGSRSLLRPSSSGMRPPCPSRPWP